MDAEIYDIEPDRGPISNRGPVSVPYRTVSTPSNLCRITKQHSPACKSLPLPHRVNLHYSVIQQFLPSTTPAHPTTSNMADQEGYRTTIHYQGFNYTRSHVTAKKISFRCSQYRGSVRSGGAIPKCEGRLFRYPDGRVSLIPHTSCLPDHGTASNAIDLSSTSPASSHDSEGDEPRVCHVYEVTNEMVEEIDRLSIFYISKTAKEIWDLINEEFYKGHTGMVHGLVKAQVISRVYRARRKHFGGDDIFRIERQPMSLVRNSHLPFFQFNHSYYDAGELQRVVGWAHPLLVDLLKYGHTSLFIDGTFRSAPKPFYQCVIVMVYDKATSAYVPVFYVLATGKTEWMYSHIFSCISLATERKLDPAYVTCDFEKALHKAVFTHFGRARLIGCFFHFKQALRKKMAKIGISEPEIQIAMEDGYMDLLCRVPIDDITPKGVPKVQEKIQKACKSRKVTYSKTKWATFWKYFYSTWLKRFPAETWNVHDVDEALVNRTNNPLERYNRHMNDTLKVHPALNSFVEKIEEDARKSLDTLETIRQRRGKAPAHAPPKRVRSVEL